MTPLDKQYDAAPVERRWYAAWLERGLFHGDAARGGTPYCIVIPPPNVTGILHMGHALNNTIQDILVRWQRMQGRNVVWMPGTDHAGIATQNVVERALRQEGLTREDLGREAFVRRVWQWREQYGDTIVQQLKRLGASCDWARERFTMDDGLSRAVQEVFVRLYEKGLIYRANYIINWCPRCRTALSDEESEHQETAGKLYYVRYPVQRRGHPTTHVVVATTRPETLLGDVAVAVSPGDERYRALVGQTLTLPVLERELLVIEDHFVDPQFGTGAVKVTPAHDPNDFEMGRRHGLTPVNVMNGDGTMNENAGPYAGLDRFECRRRILADLTAAGLVEKIEDHRHAVGHCYRCDTVIEPRLSPQWFVRMKPLAEPAIAAVREGRIRFIPDRWTKVYLDWMENIRDWCISRQIWWGHRVPVFACQGCGHEWADRGAPGACPRCGGGTVRQDEDVLDTWFSSWLWPFSTFGWPDDNADLRFYYPTNTLVTASEIIFFWVARMIMAGIEFMGDIPFREVYIHGTVRDDRGRKMSKSLGNSIDPLTVIDEYSADALRFSLMMITATGQDVFVSNEKFEIGRNFATKLWNAARYLQMQTEGRGAGGEGREQPPVDGSEPPPLALDRGSAGLTGLDAALLSADDQHILAMLQRTTAVCTENLRRYRFNDAAHDLYEFVWHQFCDWYVEYSKDVLYGADGPRRRQVLGVMRQVLDASLRLLHPFMPFVTEELWTATGDGRAGDTIMLAAWPEALPADALAAAGIREEAVRYVDGKHDLIRAGRTLRADYGIAPAAKVAYIVRPNTAEDAARLLADLPSVISLLRAERVTVDAQFAPGQAVPGGLSALGMIYMPVEGLIDVAAEQARLAGQIEKASAERSRVAQKLGNPGFVNKAPAEVVEQQRERQRELDERVEKLRRLMAMLGTG
jgi:valyl-tRNA synthetase